MAHTTQHVKCVSGADRVSEALLFFGKRIARIVPLYWLFILWTGRRDLFSLNILKDLAFIPHWSPTYPTQLYPILTQGWTLNYEMFFYALFAIAILFGSARVIAQLTALVCVPLLALFFRGEYANAAAQFYCNDIILEFGFGILLQHAVKKWGFPNWPRISFMGLVFLGFAFLSISSDTSPARSITWGLPAVLIVWAGFKAFDGWLNFRPLALLGNASYAIYLSHWTSFALLKPFIGVVGQAHTNILIVSHILIGLLAGVAIHLTIERRATRSAQAVLGLRKTSKREIGSVASEAARPV